MGSITPISPQYVFVSATTPQDITAGKFWYNTTNKKTYASNGSAYVLIADIDTTLIEQQQLAQDFNILINSSSASVLYDYDDMFLDIFSDADGYDGTIDTGNTTAVFDNESYLNSDTIENLSEETFNATTWAVGKTLECDDDIVSKLVYEYKGNDGGTNFSVKANYVYTDTSEAESSVISTRIDAYGETTFTNPNPTKSVDRVEILTQYGSGGDVYLKNAVVFIVAQTIIQTNAFTITENPQSHQVYLHNSGTGSITYDISFDGGTTWIEDQAINTKNLSSHAGTSCILILNLDNDANILAKDYSLMLGY